MSILFLSFFRYRRNAGFPTSVANSIGTGLDSEEIEALDCQAGFEACHTADMGWSGRERRFAVCVGESVPVASGAWHALVWGKVLAR